MWTRCVVCIVAVTMVAGVAVVHSTAPQEKRIEQLNEKGELTADTPKDREKTDCHSRMFSLKCVAGRTYIIDMRSDDFDTYLRLEDPAGRTIRADDDTGAGAKGTDARIVFKADKSETYTIAATSFSPGAKGKFTLAVIHDGVGVEEEIVYVLDIKGKLAKDDPKDKDRGGICYFKAYKFDMTEKATYVIRLESRDFDAFVRLLDAEGKEVAHDDDGAKEGLNAKLTHTCAKTGTYAIVATSSAHPDTGDFHLRVQLKK